MARARNHAVGSKEERFKWRMIFLSGIFVVLGVFGLSVHPSVVEVTDTAKGYVPRMLHSRTLPLVKYGDNGSRLLVEEPEECVEQVAELLDFDPENPPLPEDLDPVIVNGIEIDVNFCGSLAEPTCDVPEEFEGACCQVEVEGEFEDNAECLSLKFDACLFEELCVAELIPGSGVGAECLQDFELDGLGIPLYVFLLIYLFLALAIVCDDYFSYALDMLGDLLGMSSDVKGATFAAIGSSAPELFVSLADNVIANPPKSVGVGTIVGSAIFNILVIIGASAVVAGRTFGFLKLNWRPLMRDSAFYVLSIIGLISVAVTGEEAENFEGAILMLIYVGYLVFMAFNQKIFNYIDKKFGFVPPTEEIAAADEKAEDKDPLGEAEADEGEVKGEEVDGDDDVDAARDFTRQGTGSKVGGSSRMNLKRGATMGSRGRKGSAVGKGLLEEVEDVENEPYFSVLYWPQYKPESKEGEEVDAPFGVRYFGGGFRMWLRRAYYLLVFPINLIFRLTIPDSRYDLFGEDKRSGKKDHRPIAYWLEFVMCVVHIGIASHFLVYSAAKFGCLAGIDPAVMGLTVLAAGTSVPDMITSVILTRNGEGDAAVANSIGSNVFDILIGLGLPWFIAGFVYGGSVVATDAIGIAIGFLFGVLVVLLGALLITKFKLNTFIGIFLLVLYGAYVAFELIRAGIEAGEEN